MRLLSIDGTVLDFGCGIGKNVAALAIASGRDVHDIDFAQKMVDRSRKNILTASFERVHMMHYISAAPFAGIIAMLSLFELGRSELESMAAKWINWLKPEGILLVGVVGAEDCESSKRATFDSDGKFARGTEWIFMH